jgi:rare lipoprotein A (peptidoglycan hydrolase)
MGWREKNVTTPGEKGMREVKYRVTYKNGKEVSRVALSKNIVKDPVTQVETQGTFVKCGAPTKGQGTWYSNQGGLFAASLSIPRGGYAKVTNTANGKSVIVQINDSGPYGKGRIIDLDKVAFQKIGSISAGVIGVKVEEVLN